MRNFFIYKYYFWSMILLLEILCVFESNTVSANP
jgi:hypothetical protein